MANAVKSTLISTAITYGKDYIRPYYREGDKGIGPQFFMNADNARKVMLQVYDILVADNKLVPIEEAPQWYKEQLWVFVRDLYPAGTPVSEMLEVCKSLHALGLIMDIYC